MSDNPNLAEAEAIDWVIRIQAMDFCDWDGLEAWMARSPENAARFNALATIDAALADHMQKERRNPFHGRSDTQLQTRPPASIGRRHAFGLLGGGMLAASLVALMVFQGISQMSVSTAPGEQRELQLDPGVMVSLNGGTEISWSKHDPRTIRVVAGEALFDVEHGSGKPLKILAGNQVMRDLGTVFNVIHTEKVTQLEVASGAVIFDEGGSGLRINKGEGARFERGFPKAERFTVPPEAVAGWKTGRLVYRNASLEQIGDDLSRRFGVSLRVDEDVARQRFTGSFRIGQDLNATLNSAGALLGVQATNDGKGWVLRATTIPGS